MYIDPLILYTAMKVAVFTRSLLLLLVLVLLLAPSIHVEAVVSQQAQKQVKATGVTLGGPVSTQARQRVRKQRKERSERLQKEGRPTISNAAAIEPAGN